MAEIGNIDVIQTELGISAEWRIKNFFSSLKIDHAFYWSPPFSYAGHTWELWICRYGYKLGKSFIELCLKRRSTGPPICQGFSVALKTRNGQKDFERHFTDVFKEKNDFLSPHCISKSELLRRRRELVPSEVLTVVCTLKSPLYAGTASDTATAWCSYSKETSEADSLSWHQKKCYLALCENMERRKKCAEFLEIVFVQKYLKDYECQEEKTEGTGNALGFSTLLQEKKSLEELREVVRRCVMSDSL